MNTGFAGVVNGIYTLRDCVLFRLTPRCVGETGEIMGGLIDGYAFAAVSGAEADDYMRRVTDDGGSAEKVCRCNVVRLFGLGLGGGGVFCRILRAFADEQICCYGASVSECGIALALPCDKSDRAVELLTDCFLKR